MNKHRSEIKRLSLLFDENIKLLNESNDDNHRLALYEELWRRSFNIQGD